MTLKCELQGINKTSRRQLTCQDSVVSSFNCRMRTGGTKSDVPSAAHSYKTDMAAVIHQHINKSTSSVTFLYQSPLQAFGEDYRKTCLRVFSLARGWQSKLFRGTEKHCISQEKQWTRTFSEPSDIQLSFFLKLWVSKHFS